VFLRRRFQFDHHKSEKQKDNMQRTIAILAVFLASATAAHAQAPDASFADLTGRLKAGESVSVTTNAGETITGRVEHVSDTMLVLKSDAHDRQLAVQDVQRIALPVHTGRYGALIGLAAGFAVGSAMAAHSGCEVTCFASPAGVLLLGGVMGSIGTVVGAAVGASIHRERVVFVRPGTNLTQTTIAPIVSQARAGLQVQIAF
jgi:hypothetical protein